MLSTQSLRSSRPLSRSWANAFRRLRRTSTAACSPPTRVVRWAVQPVQPEERLAAAGPGRQHCRLRHLPGEEPGHHPGGHALPHRPQARLPRHSARAVRRRLQVPLRGHRRRTQRRHHGGDRRSLDRGLLAHGPRPDQDGKGSLRGAANDKPLAPWIVIARMLPAPTRSPSRSSRPTTLRCRQPCPAST